MTTPFAVPRHARVIFAFLILFMVAGARAEDAPQPVATQPNEQGLSQLWVFIRLWRKLKDLCNAGYSFAQLRDICDVLQLFTGGSINPDFIRQLAAFQMLRYQFKLPLVNPADAKLFSDLASIDQSNEPPAIKPIESLFEQ